MDVREGKAEAPGNECRDCFVDSTAPPTAQREQGYACVHNGHCTLRGNGYALPLDPNPKIVGITERLVTLMASLASTEKFTSTLRVRCAGQDLIRWGHLADAYDETLSSMVRRLLNQVPPRPRRPLSSVNPILLREVACAGNNLNQIARAIHVANLTGSRVQAVGILAQLAIIERQLGQRLHEGRGP